MKARGSSTVLSLAAIVGVAALGSLGFAGYAKWANCAGGACDDKGALLVNDAKHEHKADGSCCPLHDAASAVGNEEMAKGCPAAKSSECATSCDGATACTAEKKDGCCPSEKAGTAEKADGCCHGEKTAEQKSEKKTCPVTGKVASNG